MKVPKKYPKALENVSDEHYNLLFLGWKIGEGLRNNIAYARIKAYIDWFKTYYIDPHFEIEKKYVFPILGIHNVRVKKAMANHRRLLRLFNEAKELSRAINRLEEEIGRYVRFEERILFKEIESVATSEQLEAIEKHHQNLKFSDEEWEDKFWIS